MTYLQCGIGRCKADSDVVVWTVPLCADHWQQCCDEEKGCSLKWLRKRARFAIVRELAAIPTPAPPKPVRTAPIRRRGRRSYS